LSKEHASELAQHFLKGGNPDKAQEYFFKAAKRASELYAHSEAFDYYKGAIELLESTAEPRRPQSIMSRAEILRNMGDESQFLQQYEKTLDCWKRAAELYESSGEKLKAADVYVKLGMAYHLVMYELDKSEKMLEKAVELAKESISATGAELVRITAYSLIADIWRSDRQKVREKSALAVKLATESGAYDVLAIVSSYSIGTDLVGEIEESIESCNRGLKISHEHGLMWEASYNYFHRACVHTYTYGPSSKSLELFLEGLNFTAARGNFMVNLFHKVELAYGVYLPLGEWKKARELAEESLKSIQRFPRTSLFCLIAESAMGHVLLHEGELDRAEGYLEHVREATNGFGVLQLDVPLYIALSRLNVEKGDFDKAEKYLKEGYRLSKQRGLTVVNGIPHVQLLSLIIEFSLLTESEGRGSDAKFLQEKLEELWETAKKINREWPLAYCYLAEGLIAAKKKQIENAISSFQKNIDIFKKLGWPYELAKTQYQLGMVHLRRGNVLSSMKLFDAASEVFSRLGAKRDLEKTFSLKKRIQEQELPVLDEHPKFEREETELVFESLATEFMQDFLFKKLEMERCGWRTLSELSRNLKLSKHTLYGRSEGTRGPILEELLSAGIVETRTFAGERGRGGEIKKIRICYGKNASLGKFAAQRRPLEE